MKNLLIILLLNISMVTFANAQSITDAPIESVTVFLNKAQITRKATASIPSGASVITIGGLSPYLDPNSIQVSGKGAIVIKGVKHQMNYLSENELPAHLNILNDSIKYYSDGLTLEKSLITILGQEEQLLVSNQHVGSDQRNTTVAEVRAMADFFRSRMTNIGKDRIKSQTRMTHLNKRITALRKQLNEERSRWNRNTSQIVVSVSANARTTTKLELNYIVSQAGWNPSYDIRAINTKSDIELNYKANVFQNTGVDWKDINLKLSTANPNQGGNKPEFSPWYLNFYNPIQYQLQGKADGMKIRSKMEAPMSMQFEDEALEEVVVTTANFTQVIQTSLNTEFDIALKYSIPTGNKPEVVDIQNHTLKADYEYGVAPKLDKDAFLLATITGWEGLSLLPGESNIYFEGTFVSKSYIDPNSTEDTLRLSLGRDKRLVVKREQLKDFTKTQSFGGKTTKTFAYEVSVRNTKSESVSVTLEEQVPISGNKDIAVELIDKGGAQYSIQNGRLKWKLSLDPNETRKVLYKFEVKYPKDKRVSGL